MVDAAQVKAVEVLVEKLREDPTLFYTPELTFFKEYILSLGGTIPKVGAKAEAPAPEPAKEEPPQQEEEPEEPEEAEEEDPDKMAEDTEPFPDKGPEGEVELTDDQMDKQGELQGEAAEALDDGNLQKALDKYTEAIKIGNVTAKMYAKRAQLLLKMKRPLACIEDCNSALGINQNNAMAYRVRGVANRYLDRWELAQLDLGKAMQLDFDAFDDDAEATKAKKIVSDRYEKVKERQVKNRIKEEKKKADELKRRKEEAKRIYEEQKKQETSGSAFPGGFPGGMGGGFPGGMPGGMPGMPGGIDPNLLSGIMGDPELMAAFSNPKIMAAMQDIMSNPANISKYQGDPEIMALMQKVMSSFGGAGGGMPGGMPAGFPGASAAGSGAGTTPAATVEEVNEADEVD